MLSAAQRKILAQFASRHGRRKSPYFLAEGLRCCREARLRHPDWLAFTVATEAFLASPDGEAFADDGHVAIVSESEFAALTETSTPQGVLMVLHRPPAVPPERLPSPWCLILDRLQEPGNLGTILRTAWALGLSGVWLTDDCADVYAPKVVRAGMGAQFAVACQPAGELREACRRFRELGGRTVWCAMPRGETLAFSDAFRLDGASALVIGNEGNGIAHPEVGRAVTIPMPGQAESLNVAQAATVLMFEALRKSLA